jgi:c-di-GMP-binding flagellar brake protein YcgR
MPAPTRKAVENPVDRRRRRHVRFSSDFRINVNHLQGNQYRKLEGHCRDLSEAGIGILLPTEMGSGEVVGLNFSLPGANPSWEVRAVVRHRRGYHYGFEFLSLTSEQRESLKNYLKQLQPLG